MNLLLYDGVCGLCNGLVRFVLARDQQRVFRFAALQHDVAKQTLERLGHTVTELDTFYVIEDYGTVGARVLSKSRAALAVGRHLGWRWAWSRLLYIVPRSLADRIYDFIAKRRYKWFGRHDACPLPKPEHRALFLDTPS